MTRAILAVVVLAVVGLGLGGASERRAEAAGGSELWMFSAPADAPDDAEATPSFMGRMANEAVCSGVAEAMTLYLKRDQSKVVAAFQCRPARAIVIEAN